MIGRVGYARSAARMRVSNASSSSTVTALWGGYNRGTRTAAVRDSGHDAVVLNLCWCVNQAPNARFSSLILYLLDIIDYLDFWRREERCTTTPRRRSRT